MCGVRVEEEYSWPDCQSHYDLNVDYTDFYSWVWKSLYDPHGPVHVWIGGVMDCDETYDKIALLVGKEIAAELAYFSFVHRKNLFRSGLFKCVSLADVEETPDQVIHAAWYMLLYVYILGICVCSLYTLQPLQEFTHSKYSTRLCPQRISSSKLCAKTWPPGAVKLTVPSSGSSAVRCSPGDSTKHSAVLFIYTVPPYHDTLTICTPDRYVPDKRFVIALGVFGCNATGIGIP